MKNLNDKKIKWSKKLKVGDPNYLMITRCEDQWYFLTGGYVEQIISLRIAIDEGVGLRSEYDYDIETSEIDAMNFTAILKNECELLVQDQNGLWAFGIEDVESPADAILIYFRTATLHSFVCGCQKTCSLQMFRAMPPEWLDESDFLMESEQYLGSKTDTVSIKE